MERSVAGICIRGSRVFVAKRGWSGSCGGLWEFPGGKVEAGETDEHALRREFLEEFAISCLPLRLLGETRFVHGGIERTLAAWLIELSDLTSPELREHEKVQWTEIEELGNLDFVESDGRLIELIRAQFTPSA